MTTEELRKTLENNKEISAEVKENLIELIMIFNKTFEDINLSNLNERLKTLVIKRESKFVLKLPCKYLPFTNELIINKGLFEKCDAKHWLMHSLIQMISSKGNYSGFDNKENTLLALNEGYTEILTNYLVGDVENNFYTDEIIVTNLIGKIIGENILFESYFTNDSKRMLDSMKKAEGN